MNTGLVYGLLGSCLTVLVILVLVSEVYTKPSSIETSKNADAASVQSVLVNHLSFRRVRFEPTGATQSLAICQEAIQSCESTPWRECRFQPRAQPRKITRLAAQCEFKFTRGCRPAAWWTN
jgi:hypothetical protein